jgi:hypothetical protein
VNSPSVACIRDMDVAANGDDDVRVNIGDISPSNNNDAARTNAELSFK